MRKFMAMAFLAVMLFTGCGDTKTATPPPDNKTSTTQVTVEVPREPVWDTSNLDPMKNGNFQTAVEVFRKNPNISTLAIDANTSDVMRRPWDYYGKVVRFSGEAAVLQDYPPSNDLSKMLGGESCEIVMTADDGMTIVDGMLLGNTKGLQIGDYVTFVGYPCGVMEVDNKIGGKFSHLIVVGVK